MPDDHRASLDREARKLGFPDYETMVAWHEKYGRGQAKVAPGKHQNALAKPAEPQTVKKQETQSWGPGALFDWIRRRWEGAEQ